MISTTTNQDRIQFMICSGMFNAERLTGFWKLLNKSVGYKFFLISDTLRVCHNRMAKKWLAQTDISTKIEIFYTFLFASEIEPDEYLDCNLKPFHQQSRASRNKEIIEEIARNHMSTIRESPNRLVIKYFRYERIKYAA